MAKASVQEQDPDIELCGRAAQHGQKAHDDSEERRAPNGRLAVLVEGEWAGYLMSDGRGTGGKTMVLFHVEVLASKALKITYLRDCPKTEKRKLEKLIHHEREVTSIEALTDSGDRCQLFTR